MSDTIRPLELLPAIAPALLLAATVVERVVIRMRTGNARLRELATAAGMLLGSIVAGAFVGVAVHGAWRMLGATAPGSVAEVVGAHWWVEVVVAFVAWDAAGYLYHRIGHGTALGWAAHQPHHTGTHFDLSLAGRQSWWPWMSVVTFPLVALTGVSFETAAAVAVVSNLWQGLVHCSLPVRVPQAVASLVMTPATHRLHHDSGADPCNLGPVLTVWDRLAGTWRPATGPAAEDELAGPAGSSNPILVELVGWRALVRSGP